MQTEKDNNVEFQKWLKQMEVVSIPKPENYKLQDTFYRTAEGWTVSSDIAWKIFNLRSRIFRPTDIIICSFPKSGTAWLQELVYVIQTLDFKTAAEKKLEERYIFLERLDAHLTEESRKMKESQFYYTHLGYSILPKDLLEKKCKILHIARNPKDTLVSMYHFAQMWEFIGYKGTFKELFHLFANDFMVFTPFAKHFLEFWKRRNDENIIHLTYENLQKDSIGGIKRIAEFLGKVLTEEQVQQVADHCSFNQMANNPATNYSHWDQMAGMKTDPEKKYMRKGKVGDWRNYFDDELEKDYQDWFTKNFADEGVEFEYDI